MAIKRKRLTKKEKSLMQKLANMPRHALPCEGCGRIRRELGPEVISFTCEWCVLKLTEWPEQKKVNEVKRPRGWHRRKLYTDPTGQSYSYGKEITNADKRKLTKSSAGPNKPKPKRKPRRKAES